MFLSGFLYRLCERGKRDCCQPKKTMILTETFLLLQLFLLNHTKAYHCTFVGNICFSYVTEDGEIKFS